MVLPSTVSLRYPNNPSSTIDKNKITAKATQYCVGVYPPLTPSSSVEKYPVIRLTGKNRMVALASKIVILVSFSTAWESFKAIRLKFCPACQQHVVRSRLENNDKYHTKKVRDSFSVRQVSISDRQ
jgi:hypothetical protein